jgi:sulfate transport system substrate-binding protein
MPSVSILAEPPVAVIDQVALRHGTRELARAYLGHLYSDEGQEIIARHFYRPRDSETAARHAGRFPQLQLASIADFGGWANVQRVHFSNGGMFDQMSAR